MAEMTILSSFWSLKPCLHSVCKAKSAWIYSMCRAKSVWSNFALHTGGSKADFALHIEWRHRFRDQKLAKNAMTNVTTFKIKIF